MLRLRQPPTPSQNCFLVAPKGPPAMLCRKPQKKSRKIVADRTNPGVVPIYQSRALILSPGDNKHVNGPQVTVQQGLWSSQIRQRLRAVWHFFSQIPKP